MWYLTSDTLNNHIIRFSPPIIDPNKLHDVSSLLRWSMAKLFTGILKGTFCSVRLRNERMSQFPRSRNAAWQASSIEPALYNKLIEKNLIAGTARPHRHKRLSLPSDNRPSSAIPLRDHVSTNLHTFLLLKLQVNFLYLRTHNNLIKLIIFMNVFLEVWIIKVEIFNAIFVVSQQHWSYVRLYKENEFGAKNSLRTVTSHFTRELVISVMFLSIQNEGPDSEG